MTEPRIKVGMSFGTVGETINSMKETRSIKKDHSETNFTYTVSGTYNKEPFEVSVWSINVNNGGVTYEAYPTKNHNGLGYCGEIRGQGIAPDDPRGLHKIKELKYTQITDYENGLIAKDLNGNGIVDEGEIFKGDWW